MTTLPPLPEVPFVSVLTVVYNHERFVAESIESVLAEGWPEDRFEHVIVDDGSTDRTSDVVDRYRDHVRYIRQENQGVLAAVNRGIAELTGDVITGAGGDDAWREGRLERLIAPLRQNPNAGLVYSDLEVIDAEGRTIDPSFMAMSGLIPHRGRILGKLLVHNFVSGGGCMLRGCLKHLFHPVPPHAAWEDWWWAWTIASVAEVEYVEEPTYRYRRHGDNLSLGATGTKLAAALRHDVRFRRWMLAAIEPGQATPSELVEALWMLYRVASGVARERGEPLEAALPPGPSALTDRHLRAAEASLAAGQPEPALFHGMHALATDPLSPKARALIARVAPGAEAGVPAVDSTEAPAPTLETRGFVVVADADTLLDRPQLLAGYGGCFSGADDATLVILGSGWPASRLEAEVPALVSRTGLQRDDAPDMLALPTSAAQNSALRRTAHAVLDAVHDPASLRRLAEEHWARPRGLTHTT